MAGATFTIPLITVIPGQLITASLWNNEFFNLSTNLNPSGLDGYEDTDTQMQIQTAPYPGSVTSHATSTGGEFERIRYQISAILGATTPPYWYAKPAIDLLTVSNIVVPLGGMIDWYQGNPPNSNWLLANGQAINRVVYSALNAQYSASGYPFGNGDGSTTFNLPDCVNVFVMGAGGTYNAGVMSGAAQVTLNKNNIPAGLLTLNDPGHTHTITDPTHAHAVTDPTHLHQTQIFGTGVGSNYATKSAQSASATTPTTSNATGLTVNSASTGITGANSNTTGISLTDNGGSVPVNTLNPFVALYKIVRVL
jgi:microcystin-dependent protein